MSDTLIEAVRPTFKTKEAIASWLQQQATFWLQSIVDEQSADSLQPSLTKTDYDMSVFDCFSGDFGGDRDANEIADELHDSRVFARKTPVTHNKKHFDRIPDIEVEDWETAVK